MELLSPAGNMEKLKAAVLYGADAIYLAGQNFGMRAAANNFTLEELNEAVKFAHERNKKIYITINTLPHEEELNDLIEYVKNLRNLENKVDAAIVADVGALSIIKEYYPELEIHISTQAGIVNSASCNFWYKMGAKRVVLARELSLKEILEIKKNIPSDLEIEVFIHGSMCVSFSGRCLLSNNLVSRDANRGACAQPCRWNYTIREEKRPDLPFPIEEEPNEGTYIMSSKDMNLLHHIPELVDAGISSFKIEGRMKSAYYVAVVTNAYRAAIDNYLKYGKDYVLDERWDFELDSVSHRDYCTGYFFDSPLENAQIASHTGYLREKAYLAIATGYDKETKLAKFIQRNKLVKGEVVELISPSKFGVSFEATKIIDAKNMEEVESAPHAFMEFYIPVDFEVNPGDILRSSNRK